MRQTPLMFLFTALLLIPTAMWANPKILHVMKRQRRVMAVLALIIGICAFSTPGTASADPTNSNTTTFTATCTGLGDVTAVAVFFPSALARGATSAFQVVGTNTVLIWFTPGTDKLASKAGTTCTITSINGEPAADVVASFIVGSPVLIWNPAVDWRNAPNQMNPSPDLHGNPGVWSYMTLFSTTFLLDPAQYELLPNYSADFEQWNDPAFINLLVGHDVPTSPTIRMHSYGGRVAGFVRNSILAWTSPVTGKVTVAGNVQLPSLSECSVGSGIIWSIDKGAESLFETVLPAGGTSSFKLSTIVQRGETLYFVHDPGWDSLCDTALVSLQITKP